MAASGSVAFNTSNVSINGTRIFTKEEHLTTAGGASIPSTICYTDEQGGITNYVPVREFAEALQIPVDWNGEEHTVYLYVNGEQALYFMPLSSPGTVFDEDLAEVEPLPSRDGKNLLTETRHQGTEKFSSKLRVDPNGGNYVNITVTNHGMVPLKFGLGRSYPLDSGSSIIITQVPAETTVTRTMEILDFESLRAAPIYLELGNAEHVVRPIDAAISAVQFKK